MRRSWPLIFSLALLVLIGLWGYRESNARQALLVQAENQYQRSFQDLTSHLDQMEMEFSKSLVCTYPCLKGKIFADISQQAYNISEDLGQLPLNTIDTSTTERFFTQVGDFMGILAEKNIKGDETTEAEWNQLEQYYGQVKSINQELAKVNQQANIGGVRWVREERVANRNFAGLPDNSFIRGFQRIEQIVKKGQDKGFSQAATEPDTTLVMALKGDKVTPEQALAKAKNFLGKIAENRRMRYTGTAAGEIPTYRIEVLPNVGRMGRATINQGGIYLDISQVGGHVVWMINSRTVGQKKIDQAKAEAIARSFLKDKGFSNLSVSSQYPYQNTSVINFAPKEKGIILYPDGIKVQVALDNGEVIAYDARPYLTNHRDRNLSQPKLTMDQAKKKVKRITVKEGKMALIKNDLGKEVLTYEFLGTSNRGDDYKVYINAFDGEGEKIIPLRIEGRYNAESIRETMSEIGGTPEI